jgi:hypothetical protein
VPLRGWRPSQVDKQDDQASKGAGKDDKKDEASKGAGKDDKKDEASKGGDGKRRQVIRPSKSDRQPDSKRNKAN